MVPADIMLPSLETFALIDRGFPESNPNSDSDHAIYEYIGCPNLRELSFTQEIIRAMNPLQLQATSSSLVKFFTKTPMPKLRHLHLYELPVSGAGLRNILRSCPEHITHLVLSHRKRDSSPIDDDLLYELSVENPTDVIPFDSDGEVHDNFDFYYSSSYSASETDNDSDDHDGYSTASDESGESLMDHPIMYTVFPDLVDITIISDACSISAFEEFARSRWLAQWHVSRIQYIRIHTLERTVEPDLSIHLLDCSAGGLILEIKDNYHDGDM